MIKSFLICDSSGFSFYSKKVDQKFEDIQPELLSGLISAIGTIGRELVKEEIATISYGDNDKFQLTIISKEIFGSDKILYFVFILEGESDIKKMRQLCTNIFIEAKHVLKNPHNGGVDIQGKIDRLLDNRYDLKTI